MADELLGSNNLAYVEALYASYLADPASVDPQWRDYFYEWQRSDDGGHYDGQLGAGFQASSIFDPSGPAMGANGRGASQRAGEWEAPAAKPERPPATLADVAPETLAAVRALPLFRRMSPSQLAEVAQVAEVVHFGQGDLVCKEGDPGHDLFIITSGTVLIRRDGDIIAEMGPGEVVGELAVLDSRPRVADVIAGSPLSMVGIRGEDFQRVLTQHNELALNLIGVLADRVRTTRSRQQRVDALIRAYRERGHVLAQLDPLGRGVEAHPELTLEHYGLSQSDLDASFVARLGGRSVVRTLRQVLEDLRATYCGPIGVQYMHIDDIEVQHWLRTRMENNQNARVLSREEQVRILTKLTDAEVFETFLHRKYVGAKRFSLEGAESLIPLLDDAIESAGQHGVEEVLIGMAHRGRLNVLANIMNKGAANIFREYEDLDPEHYTSRGDVKYHMGHSTDLVTSSGQRVHLSLCFNPSHLEAVNPVVVGRTRAKQDRRYDEDHAKVMAILIHGDAAFAGQGVVQELLNLSELPGYKTGGTVHIIVNNQIGFTTTPEQSRSSQYATDVARMLQIPIFHVNGEHPEAVAQVIQVAMDFREIFKKDVVIDMYCYRKHGHNEGDDPTFTQPVLYDAIKRRETVRQAYVDNLLKLGGLSRAEADEIAVRRRRALEDDLAMARRKSFDYVIPSSGAGLWTPYSGGKEATVPDVACALPVKRLTELLAATAQTPPDFKVHRKIQRFMGERAGMAQGDRPLNWGAAEALAFASLVREGYRVRVTGQDAERGTFGHRHAVLHDRATDRRYVPLANISSGQGPFDVINSPLSETGVLGFEYGYSLDYPDGLTVWEAQFGDFCNVAQVIFDQFISSAEDKWNRLSGLVVLLPHGFEGQGPEHSSARLERFLMLAAQDNIQVVNLTSPAQLFFCLRRQVLRSWRKPLVVMSPKSLLRHPEAVSSLEDLATQNFRRVIPDESDLDATKVRKVLLVSGKLYYELVAHRREHGVKDIAIVRLEQYYPLPIPGITEALAPFKDDVPLCHVQEEPANMGAWQFIRMKVGDHFDTHPFSGVHRPESASPATGSAASHKIEQADLITRAFA